MRFANIITISAVFAGTCAATSPLRDTNTTEEALDPVDLLDEEQLLGGGHDLVGGDLEVKTPGLRGQRELSSCSRKKKVTMYKFCIQGDNDAGANGEHRLKLDGHWLYGGYRNYREGQCHNLNVGSRTVDAYKSLTVGTEEHDDWSENDSYFATMYSTQWYNPTCETYEVVLSKVHTHQKDHSVCWNLSAEASAKGVTVGAGAEYCSRWTTPADSFLWYMKVEPESKSSVGWKKFRNKLNQGLCMDLKAANAQNGNSVQLYRCNGTPAQAWYIDSMGRIRSGVNSNKCLEAGRSGGLYSKMYVWDCHNGMHQRWTLQSDGRIRNKAYAKYIGVASGCSGVSSGRRLELHDRYSSATCASQQKWAF